MTKTAALRNLNNVYKVFSENLINTLNFQFRAPDSIKFYELEKALLVSKNLHENKEEELAFKTLSEELEMIEPLPDLVFPMTIVYGVSHFEVLLAEMTRILLTYHYKSLSSKDKALNYEEIIKLGDYKNIQNYIIQQEVNSFSFKSISQRVKYFEKKFGLKFTYEKQEGIRKNWNCLELEDLIEVHSTRNIIVHNNSKINEFYLNENPSSELKINDLRILDKEYSMHTLLVLFRVSNSFYSVIKKKIKNKKQSKQQEHTTR